MENYSKYRIKEQTITKPHANRPKFQIKTAIPKRHDNKKSIKFKTKIAIKSQQS